MPEQKVELKPLFSEECKHKKLYLPFESSAIKIRIPKSSTERILELHIWKTDSMSLYNFVDYYLQLGRT